VVVDLAVVGDPHGAVLVGQRLMATGEIDDAETTMCENGVRIGVEPGTVRAAMR
jgi:hypothetical protein